MRRVAFIPVFNGAHDSLNALKPQTAVRVTDIERIFKGAKFFPIRMKARGQLDGIQEPTRITHLYRDLLVRENERTIAW